MVDNLRNINKHLILSILIFIGLVIATVLVILYGKGYRFGLGEGKIEFKGNGLLVTESLPDGAQVFIDGKLKTATDNTINIPPGEYEIRIVKEGYFPWIKKVKIQTEVVTKAEALLIPTAPKLESITDIGASQPVIDPTLTKIAFVVSSQSATRNGIYIFNMSANPLLTLQSTSVQIVDDTNDLFSESEISWSPDGKDIIATISAQRTNPTTYLLDTDRANNPPNDVSLTLSTVASSWTRIKNSKDKAVFDSLPKDLKPIVQRNFNILSYSPDQNKILYQASSSGTIPIMIKPRLKGINSTPEIRKIEAGSYYVYDIKEDHNYKLYSENFEGAFSWFTSSRHIIYVREKELHIVEYDGLNDTVVYAGPFIENYLFPWPDASRILILTNLGNLKIHPNLYTISLK
ncbi:MAG: PEGA domain-containing protein [Candidatus Levybacteria bacterium]|nr:PEGA domain-containing protein [Candidatus Levybacteria bacterium]